MSAILLRGRPAADAVLEHVRSQTDALSFRPRLVFVRAGDDPASESYVRAKARKAEAAGIRAETVVLPAATDQAELLATVRRLNDDADVDGILVQLPLYAHLDESAVLEAIDPAKDVDGFHPVNVGRLWSGEDGLVPATPAGLLQLLDHYGYPVEGRRAVVVGRSNLVGKPAAALLLRRHATVLIAHSRTPDLAAATREADILVVAVGRPGLVGPAMVKPGAVVLDVGLSRVAGEIRGDVDPAVAEVAGALTPMPGGTGPMTVAMVIRNTVLAAIRRRGVRG